MLGKKQLNLLSVSEEGIMGREGPKVPVCQSGIAQNNRVLLAFTSGIMMLLVSDVPSVRLQ